MLGWQKILEYGLAISDKVLALFLGKQKADERAEHREAGRNEQKVSDLEGQKAQAGVANAIDEDVRRMSDSELDDSLPVRNKPKADAR